MGDRKDAMDGNPKARGGRRRQKLDKDKYPPSRLAGLKHFQPGQSGNKGGRPRQHHEAVAFLRGNMELIQAAMMDIVERGLQGKLTASDKILSSHLEFIWQAAFGRHPQSVLIGGGLDIGNPEDTGGVTALLARARLESERRTARRLESRPDFIASPTGEISAAPPPSPVESAARIGELYQVAVAAMEGAPATESAPPPKDEPAPPQDAKASVNVTPPPPFQPEPDPAPKSKPAPKPAPKATIPHGAPAGYAEFLSAKATEERDDELAKMQEEARKDPARFPGGQVPMSMLKPDPRPQQEIVNFTRVPGGKGIRRIIS